MRNLLAGGLLLSGMFARKFFYLCLSSHTLLIIAFLAGDRCDLWSLPFITLILKLLILAVTLQQTSNRSGCKEQALAGTRQLGLLWDQVLPALCIAFSEAPGKWAVASS